MKKTIIVFGAIIVLGVISVITFLKFKDDNNLVKLKMSEVTHSVFYAPLYSAIENGYFEEEGIEIELVLTPGADKVAAAVLSDDVNIDFAGTEAITYVYAGGEEDYLQSFAGLTKRDGQFIVSKIKIDDFKIADMIGKDVLVGRVGGTPALSFEKAVKNSGVDPKEINMDYSVEYGALVGAFIGGNSDFVNLFEPNALKLEQEGLGYVVASVGQLGDVVPYTTFFARNSYINDNEELLIKFTNALAKGIEFVKENNNETIAKAILKQFPDESLNELTAIVKRYKEANSWFDDPFITEESFNTMQQLFIDAEQLEKEVPYNKVIRNLYEK